MMVVITTWLPRQACIQAGTAAHAAPNSAAAAIASRLREAEARALTAGITDRSGSLAAAVAATEAQLLVLQAAYEAELAFGALEDAYRRPLQGPDGPP